MGFPRMGTAGAGLLRLSFSNVLLLDIIHKTQKYQCRLHSVQLNTGKCVHLKWLAHSILGGKLNFCTSGSAY